MRRGVLEGMDSNINAALVNATRTTRPVPSARWTRSRRRVARRSSVPPLVMRTCVRVTEATILHADLDAFFASVEQRDDPRLRGRPVIVGGGVVLAASYEAKAYGIHTAMGGRRARRLCPDAVVVTPRMEAYSEASKAVFEVFEDTTPLVEGISIDEAFLDVRGMRRIAGSPDEIARAAARARARAGRAADHGRRREDEVPRQGRERVAKPDGLLVVPPERRAEFLHPLPVERLWGVGPVTAGSCTPAGRRRSGRSRARRGRPGRRCSGAASAGTCTRWRTTATRGGSASAAGGARSARSAHSAAGRTSPAELDAILVGARRSLDAAAARRPTASAARSTLRLRFDDFTRATRSYTLPESTAETAGDPHRARALLGAAMPMIEARGLTLIGHRGHQPRRGGDDQLALPLDRRGRARRGDG